MTFTYNSILFRIRSGVDTLSRCSKFDNNILLAARYILDNVDRFLEHRRSLYLFSIALYDMATAQQRLELAEQNVEKFRQQRATTLSRHDVLASAVVSDAGILCKERTLDSHAEMLHLEFRIKQLMELTNAESATSTEHGGTSAPVV